MLGAGQLLAQVRNPLLFAFALHRFGAFEPKCRVPTQNDKSIYSAVCKVVFQRKKSEVTSQTNVFWGP